MRNNEVADEMKRIEQSFSDAYTRISENKQQSLLNLLERARRYPNGYKFPYPSPEGGEPHVGVVVSGYLPNTEVGDTDIWYACSAPSLYTHEDEIFPLRESTITSAIAKLGTPEQEV